MSEVELLSESAKQQIDHWLTKFPADKRRSACAPALRIAQEENGGWASEDVMNAVADYLEIPRIQVYEVATFYDMIETEPMGKHKICVCTNVSCQLRGSAEVVKHFQEKLGIGLGETTSDGMVTLKEVECLAACGGAPMCQVNDKDYIENLTPEKIDKIIEGIYAEKGDS